MRKRLILVAAVPLAAAALAQEDDVFGFIPDGGRTLLEGALEAGLDPAELAEARGAEAWAERLAAGLPGTGDLDEWERTTLADYLAYAGAIGDPGDLPWDGRDMTLQKCQSCHIVTVVVTQDRTREAWLGTMGKPSHVEIELTDAERAHLADYLVVNAGIPIDLVPPELRAGGASY